MSYLFIHLSFLFLLHLFFISLFTCFSFVVFNKLYNATCTLFKRRSPVVCSLCTGLPDCALWNSSQYLYSYRRWKVHKIVWVWRNEINDDFLSPGFNDTMLKVLKVLREFFICGFYVVLMGYVRRTRNRSNTSGPLSPPGALESLYGESPHHSFIFIIINIIFALHFNMFLYTTFIHPTKLISDDSVSRLHVFGLLEEGDTRKSQNFRTK